MEKQENGKGIASLVLGIISCALILLGALGAIFGLVTGILAIVFAVQQRKIDVENKVEKNGMRMAGFVLGIIGTTLNAIILIVALIALYIIAAVGGAIVGSLA